MTPKSKAVIAAYYGKSPRLSYWNEEQVIHRAVIAACDALDGVRDGLLEIRRAARSIRKPQTLQIAGGMGGDHFNYVVLKDANWDLKSLNYDSDIAIADGTDDGTIKCH